MVSFPFARSSAASDKHPRTAIIDIGSNSIRLVVYQGPARLPAVLFNEKVLAGLGRGLAATGTIEAESLAMARTALARFAAVTREMEVTRLRTVATAAVRDASNGQELIDAATSLGLKVELLSGEEEARAAGQGVLSGIPDADGIVGDLGGGSLELVRVKNGELGERVSLPLGVLRIPKLRGKGAKSFESEIAKRIADAGWRGAGRDLPFYLVGGSWRALARLDMIQSSYPLPIIHQYAMAPPTIGRLSTTIPAMTKAQLRAIPGISSGRIATLGDAAELLRVLIGQLGSNATIVSAFGLREGLLYGDLDEATQRLDPLVVATRQEGRLLGRFPEHGDLLHDWIAPLFEAEGRAQERIRHAACHLADVGWHANPEFRAERGVEVALHGNWVGIEAGERAMLAQALFTALGGGTLTPAPLGELTSNGRLQTAIRWGLAIRLGQRLSGGLAGPLQRSSLSLDKQSVTLRLSADDRAFYGETVERRHAALAAAFDRSASLVE